MLQRWREDVDKMLENAWFFKRFRVLFSRRMVNHLPLSSWKGGGCRRDLQQIYHLMFDVSKKGTTLFRVIPLRTLDFTGFLTCRSSASAGRRTPCRDGLRRGPSHQNLRCAWFCTGASWSSKFAKTLEIPASFKRLWYIFWTSLVHLPLTVARVTLIPWAKPSFRCLLCLQNWSFPSSEPEWSLAWRMPRRKGAGLADPTPPRMTFLRFSTSIIPHM